MLSAVDRYIYLTRNHYINSGQAKKDITYMNRIFNQENIKVGKTIEKELTNAIYNLYDGIQNISMPNMGKNKTVKITSVAQANSILDGIERNVNTIIEYCSDGGYIDKQYNIISNIMKNIDINNVEENIKEIQSILVNTVSTLKRVFITGNVNINKAITKLENVTNLYKKQNTNVLNVLLNIKVAAIRDIESLMVTLRSCYAYITLDYARQRGVNEVRKDVQKMMAGLGLKDYKPSKLVEPKIVLKQNGFRPTVHNNKNSISITYNSVKMKVNRIVKPIKKNFDKILEKDIFMSDIRDDIFLYHFANLTQFQIKGGSKAQYNAQLSPLGLDIARNAAIVLGVKKFMKDNNISKYYYNKNKVQSVKNLVRDSKLNLAAKKPWTSAIDTSDRRYFNNRAMTPQKRISNILSDLHKEKIRIAIK